MKKNFANVKTPTTSQNWKMTSEENRIIIISKELKKNVLYKDFEVIKASDDGQIVFKIERIISAKQRGLLQKSKKEK